MRRARVAKYVGSTAFEAIDPAKLIDRAVTGERADAAIACWVLQHSMDPQRDIDTLARALRPGGRLMAVNNLRRAVPSDGGWVDDGLDIATMLDARFRRLRRDVLDASRRRNGSRAPRVHGDLRGALTHRRVAPGHSREPTATPQPGISARYAQLIELVAEREGFEPPLGCPKPDFESGAFDHSAISPAGRNYT